MPKGEPSDAANPRGAARAPKPERTTELQALKRAQERIAAPRSTARTHHFFHCGLCLLPQLRSSSAPLAHGRRLSSATALSLTNPGARTMSRPRARGQLREGRSASRRAASNSDRSPGPERRGYKRSGKSATVWVHLAGGAWCDEGNEESRKPEPVCPRTVTITVSISIVMFLQGCHVPRGGTSGGISFGYLGEGGTFTLLSVR